MRINLTKKDLVNLVYMQLGFSKQISENLIEDFLATIVTNIKNEKKLKLSKFENFPFFKFIIKSGRLYIGNFSNPSGAINLNSLAL